MSYASPLLRYHRPPPYKRWLKDYELVALGTLLAGVGTGAIALLFATGRVRLASTLAIAGALTGGIIAASQIVGEGARAEHEKRT